MSRRGNSPERAWLCKEHRHPRTEILTIGHMGDIPCDLCGKTPAELVSVTLSIYAPLDVGIGFVSTGQAWANPRWRETRIRCGEPIVDSEIVVSSLAEVFTCPRV